MAKAVKGTVKIAYWDTEQQGGRPPLLGEIKGTPTIRLYKPKKKQGNSNARKDVVDYQYERKAQDMKRFLDEQMPSFIETIRGTKDLTTFTEKAERNGALPRVLLFTSKAKTSSLTKFISTEFRRRILLAEVYPTKTNKEIMDKFGITDLPAMVVIRKSEQEGEEGMDEVIRYEGDGYTKNKLLTFLSAHALKEPYFPPKKKNEEAKDEQAEQDKKKKEKVEL